MAMITIGQAREIAALYQSPGTDGKRLAAFASSGTVLPGLADDVRREIENESHKIFRDQLRALLRWVETAQDAECNCSNPYCQV